MIALLIIAVILITSILLVISHECHLYRLYRNEASLPEEHPEFDVKIFRKRSVNLAAWMAIKSLAVTLCYAVAIEAVSLTAGEAGEIDQRFDTADLCSPLRLDSAAADVEVVRKPPPKFFLFSLFFNEGVRGSFLRWAERVRSAVRERLPTPSLEKRGRKRNEEVIVWCL